MIENKVVVSVSGGNVNGVFTSDPNTKVYLVDYDNLETDPSDDCSRHFPADKIETFRSKVADEVQSFPGVTKLLTLLGD